ncbi:MAG: hypothetical protein KDE09_24135 [Anaerolineales bacterium]|nr:hypothetical protein [Anaerolineales bacterium]
MESFAEQYAERFDWRRGRQIHNLEELSHIMGAGDDPLNPPSFAGLLALPFDNEIDKALANSIVFLSAEAMQAFVQGYFQACVLTCGAVLERVLKLEYRRIHGSLPGGHWTLGRCIHQLDWRDTAITTNHLNLISEFLGPRNSRAHALLEHDNPEEANMGGQNRGVEILSEQHYTIEPFRGDAWQGMLALYPILADIYGDPALST